MVRNIVALELAKFKSKDETFIFGVEGALRRPFLQETLLNFFYNPLSYNPGTDSASTFVKCIFAITDKRVIIIGKTEKDYPDENQAYSLNFDEINIQFKRRFGGPVFIFSFDIPVLFNFIENKLVFEVNHKYYEDAERLNGILSEHKL